MKSVIVTGAYGGMGYCAVRALREKGYFVFALDRKVKDAEDGVMPIEADHFTTAAAAAPTSMPQASPNSRMLVTQM